MAFYDQSLLLSNAQTIGAVTTNVASTTIYDVTGAGSGVAPSMIWGTSTFPGADMGLGYVTYLNFIVTTAFSTGGATLQVKIQSAPAIAANLPGTWVDLYISQAFTGAQLTAGAQLIAPLPPVAPIKNAEALPRFYRFDYVVGTASFTAGAFTAGLLLNPPSGFVSTLYPNNFASGL